MDSRDKTVGESFGGSDVTSEQHPFQCLAATDQTMKLLDSAGAGKRPDPHFGHADPGVIGHQPEIAGNRHLAAAAQREAVNCGNHPYRQSFDAIEACGYPLQIAIAQGKTAPADTGIAFCPADQIPPPATAPP